MKKLLILKAGTTYPEIREVHGDFEDFIIKGAELTRNEVDVIDLYKGEKIPGTEDYYGAIITGSHSMVTERAEWSIYVEEWLKKVRYKNLPILGICYGHQLIAQAYGGIVGYHKGGDEAGMASVELTEDGREDLLLGILPDSFRAHVSHSQTVLKLPRGSVLLAKNSFEPHHAFRIDRNIWCVQFHPESNADISRRYLELEREQLIKTGKDFEALYSSIEENLFGKTLLKRFVQLAYEENQKDNLIYDGWLKVLRRKINGREYEILKDYNAVSAIIVNEADEILLVRQYRPALLRETLELPAGTLDNENESEIDALVRELKEETGIVICPEKLIHTIDYKPMVGFSNSLMKVYLAKVNSKQIKAEAIKDEDVFGILWVGLDELEKRIRLGEIQDVKTILAYYYLKEQSS